MNRKKIYILLTMFLLVAGLKSYAVTVNVSAGGLKDAISDKSITTLVVGGSLDVRDIQFIAEELTELQTLNISLAEIKAYTSMDLYFNGASDFKAHELPAYCFMEKNYTSVKLPKTLQSIGDGAFAGCGSLADIELPGVLVSVGNYAFNSCDALTSVVLPASLKHVGDGAFSRCAKLETVDLSAISADCEFGDNVFANNATLSSARLSNQMKKISSGMFGCCEALTTVELGNSPMLETIGENAFILTGLSDFPFATCSNLQTIGMWAFAGVGLQNVVLPDGVKSIGEGVFFCNESLQSIVMPTGITEVSDFMLAGDSSLSGDLMFNSEIKSVGRYAFSDLDISSVNFGSELAYVGDRAFENNASLKNMSVGAKEVPALGENVFAGVDQPNVKLSVLPESVDKYKAAAQWKEFKVVGELSTLENIVNSEDVRAYFVDKVLNVTSDNEITSVSIYDPSGVLLISRQPNALTVQIDMSSMAGNLYVVGVKTANGGVKIVKLIR